MLRDEEENAVRQIGEEIGYGRVMQAASDIWSKKDPIGALTVGPCRSQEDRLARVDEGMATRLKLSIELNARMVTRLQKLARQLCERVEYPASLTASDILDISHDKDPWN